MSIRKSSTQRVRRSPEASRENILGAAERLLVRFGPQSLRLADVAGEAGISNATVLHHFGSIDTVQAALMEKMIGELVSDILAMELPSEPQAARAATLEYLFATFEKKGAARLAAWLELTGESRRLKSVREAVQKVTGEHKVLSDLDPEFLEDAILISVVLAMGVGLFGPTLGELLGKSTDQARQLALALLGSANTDASLPE